MHDFAYYLGFDDPHWNSQQYNNGLETRKKKNPIERRRRQRRVSAAAQAGCRSPACIATTRDMNTGCRRPPPQTNMFLWQPQPGAFYAPCVDGDYDTSRHRARVRPVIENRLIGKGVGARQGTHAGAMGEAFGDFEGASSTSTSSHYFPPSPGRA